MDRPHRIALSIDEFAQSAGIGRTQVYAEIKAGRLKPVKVGRRTLVPTDEARRWLERLGTTVARSHEKRDAADPPSNPAPSCNHKPSPDRAERCPARRSTGPGGAR